MSSSFEREDVLCDDAKECRPAASVLFGVNGAIKNAGFASTLRAEPANGFTYNEEVVHWGVDDREWGSLAGCCTDSGEGQERRGLGGKLGSLH